MFRVDRLSYSHFSYSTITQIRSVEAGPADLGRVLSKKPAGFWLSVDGPKDWVEFCQETQWGPGPYRYQVCLHRGAKLLVLKDKEDFRFFSTRYGVGYHEAYGRGIHPELVHQYGAHYYERRLPDWTAVGKDYEGIVIPKFPEYFTERELAWFEGWDCACACIWDARAIKSFERVHNAMAA